MHKYYARKTSILCCSPEKIGSYKTSYMHKQIVVLYINTTPQLIELLYLHLTFSCHSQLRLIHSSQSYVINTCAAKQSRKNCR